MEKVSMPKKFERGDLLGFFYTQSVAKPKKIEGEISFRQKVSQCRKN